MYTEVPKCPKYIGRSGVEIKNMDHEPMKEVASSFGRRGLRLSFAYDLRLSWAECCKRRLRACRGEDSIHSPTRI